MNCHFVPVKQAATELDMPLTPSQRTTGMDYTGFTKRSRSHACMNTGMNSVNQRRHVRIRHCPAILDNKIGNEKHA
jgi:hypothetical protein